MAVTSTTWDPKQKSNVKGTGQQHDLVSMDTGWSWMTQAINYRQPAVKRLARRGMRSWKLGKSSCRGNHLKCMSKPPYKLDSNVMWNYRPVKNEIGADHVSKHKNACKWIQKWGERLLPRMDSEYSGCRQFTRNLHFQRDWKHWPSDSECQWKGKCNIRARGAY